MNILLTGGAGYIGSHACLSLIDAGHNITIIDNLSNGNKQLIPKKTEFINTNINIHIHTAFCMTTHTIPDRE